MIWGFGRLLEFPPLSKLVFFFATPTAHVQVSPCHLFTWEGTPVPLLPERSDAPPECLAEALSPSSSARSHGLGQ